MTALLLSLWVPASGCNVAGQQSTLPNVECHDLPADDEPGCQELCYLLSTFAQSLHQLNFQ